MVMPFNLSGEKRYSGKLFEGEQFMYIAAFDKFIGKTKSKCKPSAHGSLICLCARIKHP